MSLIQITNLTFSYPGSLEILFDHVSLQLDTQWKLGLTGRNGRGKTTFLKLLLGSLPYQGSIHTTVDFDYFPFDVETPDWLTVDVAERIVPDVQLWQLQKELSLLQVTEDVLYRPFETLSPGERTKVLLAALFLKKNSFLLIDEPTNHLDFQARQAVAKYLQGKKGFLLVSHDRWFLDQCIDHILSINKADIQIQKGNFSTWQQNKERQDAFELAEHEKLQKEVKKLTASARQTARWSDLVEASKSVRVSGIKPDKGYIGHKAAKKMKQAKVMEARRERAVEEKAGLLKNLEKAEILKIHPLVYPKEVLAEFTDVTIRYGETVATEQLNLQIRQGDRLALSGKNGSGKSSILKLLVGEGVPYEGTIWLGSQLKVSYIPQDTSFLRGGLTAFARESGIDESLFKTILRKLDFSRLQFEQDMANYSGGQKKKVLLAKSLCQEAHLYVWDEPLNFIDVLSRMQMEELLLAYAPTMIFVEHDYRFRQQIATAEVSLDAAT